MPGNQQGTSNLKRGRQAGGIAACLFKKLLYIYCRSRGCSGLFLFAKPMNRPQFIATDYKVYKDMQFVLLTEGLAAKNPTSPYGDVAAPTLADYQELVTAFKDAASLFATGVRTAKPERDHTRNVLEVASRQWSAFAELTTPSRPDQWATAGFPLTKEQTNPRTPSVPAENFKLGDGSVSLSLAASCEKQPGMYCYAWRIRLKNGSTGRFVYETLISREPRIDILGLDAETAYSVECAPWNNTGPLQWSAALSRTVQ